MGMCVVPHCKNHTCFYIPPTNWYACIPNSQHGGKKTNLKPSVYTSLLAVYFKYTLWETLTLGQLEVHDTC